VAIALAIGIAAGVSGCADRGEPIVVAPVPPAPVSLANDVQPIFDAGCVSCHGPGSRSGDLDLSDGTSRASLVNVDAFGYPGRKRVVPGDAIASVLWHKLAGTGQAGDTMPPGGAPLDTALVSLVRRWIDQGAGDN